jgi:hypothetical protein
VSYLGRDLVVGEWKKALKMAKLWGFLLFITFFKKVLATTTYGARLAVTQQAVAVSVGLLWRKNTNFNPSPTWLENRARD